MNREQEEADRPLRRLNLNQLYALDAVLRAPTLTRAGQLIRLSQPTMSLTLRRLREQFDDDLVIYTTNGRRLTALAEALRPRVHRLLHQAQGPFDLEIQFDPASTVRTVTLAAPEFAEISFLTSAAIDIIRDAPNLVLNFTPLDYPSNEAMFNSGVDVAIIPESMLNPEFSHAMLLDFSISCLVCLRNPLINDDWVTPAQYAAARHVALSPQLETAAVLRDLSHPLLRDRKVVAWTKRLSMLPGLIADSDLIATMPDWLSQYMAYLHPLKSLPSPLPGKTAMFLQWETCRDREPVIVWLRERLQALAAERWRP